MTETSSRELETWSGVAPLSPFLWQVPSCGVVVPVGCEVGPVADVCVQAKELSLRFDQLVSELEGPYYHPVSDVFRSHPLHTHALSKHQFDVLRYGMVVDRSARLVLVAVPRQCGDSGAIAAAGYEALHGTPLFQGSCDQQHPLHEEHVFVVYQLSADDTAAAPLAQKTLVRAKALFRLVFRNEAYLNNPSSEQSKHFPVYILRAVFISNSEFYHIHQEVAHHRRFHANPVHPDTGRPTPDARVLQMLEHPAVVEIANAWIQVVEGILSSRYELESVPLGATSGSSDLSSPRRADRGGAATSITRSTLMDDQRFPLLTTRTVRTSYCHAFERMVRRIDVTRKSRDLVAAWRSGDLDVAFFAPEVSGAEPLSSKAPCVRVLFRETRSGHNFIEDGELVAFLPQEADCERLQVYSNVAAERLRLWVLRSLITAEVQGIHVLLLELDPALMIAQCVGLLRGSESNRDREVLFHLCKIVVETVEDYLQHTGNVWRVTIAVAGSPSDFGGVDVERLCVDILECVQLAKHRLELERVTSSADSAAQQADASQTGAATAGRDRTNASLYTAEQLVAQRAPLSENVIFAATTHRVLLTDDKLYPLFQYCDTNTDGFVSVRDLVLLMLCKENKIDRAHMTRNGYETPLSDAEALRLQASRLVAHPLCPLDGCGLPFDEATMYAFVHSFCRHRSADGEDKLNYLEFSMMMLALARR